MRSRRTEIRSCAPEATTGGLAAVATAARRGFGKNPGCPSSDELLRLCDERRAKVETPLTNARRAALRRHLTACDFCAAEAQLLAAHAGGEPKQHQCRPAQMPVHLYALARALLARPPRLIEVERTPTTPVMPELLEAFTDA